MAALFVDLDGTLFQYGTNRPNAGWVEAMHEAQRNGHQLIFTTKRESQNSVQRALAAQGLKGFVITNVDSPRVLFNDEGAFAVNHETDDAWRYDLYLEELP